MTGGMDWQGQVGRSWADHYAQTDRSFSGLTQQLLDRISGHSGNAILDLGCGAGELSLALARARPQARIVGLDISGDLIAVARSRGEHRNIEFVSADAASWQPADFEPNLLVSRHGVMFFDDPPAAFAHLEQLAAPDAHLVFSCFRAPRENAWAADLFRMLDQPPGDPHAPGPFAFADPQWIETVLSAGGWSGIDIAPVDFAYVAGHGPDPVAEAASFFARIGPAARAMREMPAEQRGAMAERLVHWLREHKVGDLVAFGAAAWIVTARASSTARQR